MSYMMPGYHNQDLDLTGWKFKDGVKLDGFLAVDGKDHIKVNWETVSPGSLKYFYAGSHYTTVDTTFKDLNYTTDMSYMFYDCCDLVDFDSISDWDMSHITNIEKMFVTDSEHNAENISA